MACCWRPLSRVARRWPVSRNWLDSGQMSAEALFQPRQAGQVSHHVLRAVTAIPRRLLWKKHIDPDR
jgi:hypothetical protein